MDLATKLQLHSGQRVEVRGTPGGVDLGVEPGTGAASALMVFAADRAALGAHRAAIVAAASADRLTWVAYPKAGRLGTDLNRDSLAAALVAEGVRPVRQVAIDETWSALRFRPGTP